ncbi:MAG TPA: tetratricopeptide repeat protein [Fimbriimonadaceae bacterium]|nr:tetratricopeptide repeat protein [Fimbriimonadaceae bacterium]
MALVGKWFGFGKDEAYDRAIKAYDQGDYADAIGGFEACLEAGADPAMVRLARFYIAESHAHLGQSALAREQFGPALEHLLAAIEIHPNYPDLRLQLALTYQGLGDTAKQIESIETSLRLNPNYALAILHQGILWCLDGRIDEGLKRVAQAVGRDSNLRGDRYESALQAFRSGDTDRGISNLRAMAVQVSDDANAHAKIADGFARDRHWHEALQEYEAALRLAPRYADIQCRYGQALLQTDAVSAATEAFRAALDVNPKYADAHAYLGIALRRLGDENGAQASFRAALEFDPHHAIAGEEITRMRAS